jgi:ubiquinone/menaquinone biosynthesis C-methylase UbiE
MKDARKDNRSYYDDFAAWYEKERHHGYHALLDRLQIEIAADFCRDREVLEIGCGTGMILKEIAPLARHAKGVDISPGMLEKARARGLDVVEGSATALPYPDASFDAAYSFKVLAHVEDIRAAMSEVHRVLRPGGVAALEFYNKRSIRYAIKRFKRPNKVSEKTNDHEVYTRYDSLDDVKSYLPGGPAGRGRARRAGVHPVRTGAPRPRRPARAVEGRTLGARSARDGRFRWLPGRIGPQAGVSSAVAMISLFLHCTIKIALPAERTAASNLCVAQNAGDHRRVHPEAPHGNDDSR